VNGFGVLLVKELREQWRTNRLPVVATVFLLFGIASPVLARYLKELVNALGEQATGGIQIMVPEPTVADAIGQLLKNLGQFGILIAILLAMGTVAAEKEHGTAALILTKPASRLSFLLAKFVAIGTTLAVAVVLGCGLGAAYTVLLFDGARLPLGGLAGMTVLLWLAISAYAALTFLGSTVTHSALAGAGIGFAALVVTGIIAALPTIGAYMPISLLVPAANVAVGEAPGGELLGPVLVALLFICVPFGLAWLSFRHQEL
jgi:ABC-2 type transport system permease protein